jgi:hypothetical protein
LILKEEIIDWRDYHNKSVDITWKDGELRKYLNDEVYYRFSENDRESIIEATNKKLQ